MKSKVLVIGETCEDVFKYGLCKRLSPEGPVPVFSPKYEKRNIGMAGNVKSNLESLGVDVDIITNPEKIIKERYVEDKLNHLLLRVDIDDRVKRVDLSNINLKNYCAVVISDYDKGFLTREDIEFISKSSKLVFLDSKKELDSWCLGISFIKINEHEYNRISKKGLEEEIKKSLIVTLGRNGCRYDGEIYKTKDSIIGDVSGAGDTFLAGLVASYLNNNDIIKSISYANSCASKVVSIRGVSVVDVDDI